jgi:hypothetical protein
MVGVLVLGAPHLSWAGHVTDLASTLDAEGVVNADLRVGYQRTLRRGAVKREYVGQSMAEIPLIKELRFNQVRQILNLRSDLTLWKAFQVYLEFPIVLSDTRSFDFAQNNGDPCGSPPETSCVTPRNTTLGRDGFLDTTQMSQNQVAVGGPAEPPGGLLLPRRAGIDQMTIGIAGAPLSQQRDSTKPTWVIGFEARLAVGSPMEYDPARPSDNTSVGRGVHQYMWWTSVSRRYRYVDPWMTFFYLLPDAKDSSLQQRTTFPLSGQERSGPPHRGGTEVGLEIIPYERLDRKHRVSVELSARLEGVFEGRDYSDIWELFANSKSLKGPCQPDSPTVRPGYWGNGTYCGPNDLELRYPGITSIENYTIFTGTLAVGAEITRFLRARVGVSLGHEEAHAITFGDAGRSGGAANGVPGTPCASVGGGSICTHDEQQVNPLYRPLIDSPGRRFRVADTTIFDVFVSAVGQF